MYKMHISNTNDVEEGAPITSLRFLECEQCSSFDEQEKSHSFCGTCYARDYCHQRATPTDSPITDESMYWYNKHEHIGTSTSHRS